MAVSPLSLAVIERAAKNGMTQEVGDAITETTVNLLRDAMMAVANSTPGERKTSPPERRVLDLIFAGLLYEQGYL